MLYLARLTGFIVLCLLPLTGSAEALIVEGAWVRMPPPVADTAAVYLNITNNNSKLVKINSVTTNAAEQAEFHSMTMHGDMMHMSKMENVVIQPNETIVFDAGGNHLMLIGLTRLLNAGDIVDLEIKADDGSVYRIKATVKDLRKKSQTQEHHHHH